MAADRTGGTPSFTRYAQTHFEPLVARAMELADDYLRKVIYEFKMERLGIRITQMKPLSKKTEDKVLHNLVSLLLEKFIRSR